MKKTKHQKFTKENGLESFVPNRAEKRWSLRFHLFFSLPVHVFQATRPSFEVKTTRRLHFSQRRIAKGNDEQAKNSGC